MSPQEEGCHPHRQPRSPSPPPPTPRLSWAEVASRPCLVRAPRPRLVGLRPVLGREERQTKLVGYKTAPHLPKPQGPLLCPCQCHLCA